MEDEGGAGSEEADSILVFVDSATCIAPTYRLRYRVPDMYHGYMVCSMSHVYMACFLLTCTRLSNYCLNPGQGDVSRMQSLHCMLIVPEAGAGHVHSNCLTVHTRRYYKVSLGYGGEGEADGHVTIGHHNMAEPAISDTLNTVHDSCLSAPHARYPEPADIAGTCDRRVSKGLM